MRPPIDDPASKTPTIAARPAFRVALRPMPLPNPSLDTGKAFADALRLRRTTREIDGERLDAQTLSNLLYAACGVNRARGPFGTRGSTAASASNSREVDVYVALEQGAYLFEPDAHRLLPVVADDVRRLAYTPGQPSISPDAPVQLVYVADLEKLEHTRGFDEPGLHDPDVQRAYSFVDTGLIAANVYLFAAAHGLACWFHNCDRVALAHRLRLRDHQRVLFAQTVGHPARPIEGERGA
jgi:nitroreductase